MDDDCAWRGGEREEKRDLNIPAVPVISSDDLWPLRLEDDLCLTDRALSG